MNIQISLKFHVFALPQKCAKLQRFGTEKDTMYSVYMCSVLVCIIESVDSISRDERDVPLTQYITNA